MNKLKVDHATKVRSLVDNHSQVVNELQSVHDTEIKKLQFKWDEEFNLRTALEKQLKADLEALRIELSREIRE